MNCSGLGRTPAWVRKGPELLGLLEGLVDFKRLGDIDAAVVVFLGVVEFAEGGVAGAGVVPWVGAFLGDFGEGFDNLNFKGGIQLV